jgi:FkbM family methyltransferase
MANDPAIREAEVEVRALAAWNKDEEITFNVIEFSTNGALAWKNKLSSILTRTDNSFASHQVAVDAIRLDSMVTTSGRSRPKTIALWIDVEGAGYEVLEGISGIAEQVCVVHIEVETTDYWRKQHLWTEVRDLMLDFGHTAVARTRGNSQFDVVFVNNRFMRRNPVATLGLVLLAWLRRIARDAVKLVWWTR